MKNKIDIHADDYGLTMNTSKEILKAVNAKKLDSISVVPNMSNYEDALVLWRDERKEGKEPDISVHLNFMEGHCCASKQEVSSLVDGNGYFRISWIDLVKYNYNIFKYRKIKRELKSEIRQQLWKVIDDYSLLNGKELRVDSHQHTHMIPIVMKALLEVLEEDNISTEYIRISRECVLPYLRFVKYYHTYRIVNLVKVVILNFFSMEDERMLKKKHISFSLFSGVFLSGKMDIERVGNVLPYLKKKAEQKKTGLEVIFHPGSALQEEVGEEFVNKDAVAFYLSENRKTEYHTVMNLKK